MHLRFGLKNNIKFCNDFYYEKIFGSRILFQNMLKNTRFSYENKQEYELYLNKLSKMLKKQKLQNKKKKCYEKIKKKMIFYGLKCVYDPFVKFDWIHKRLMKCFAS